MAIPRRLQLAANTGASGAMITAIEAGSPADKAGLLARDILVALDGAATEGVDDLLRRLNADRIGKEVAVSLLRGGKRIDLKLTPSERGQ
jgi:S1-C subfamily serine protease